MARHPYKGVPSATKSLILHNARRVMQTRRQLAVLRAVTRSARILGRKHSYVRLLGEMTG